MRLGQNRIRFSRNIRRAPEYGCRSDFRKTANVCYMRHNAVVQTIANCIRMNGGQEIEMEKFIGKSANGKNQKYEMILEIDTLTREDLESKMFLIKDYR